MKKKTIFKVLPALLIAPILACCITLYANASESEDQSVFDKILFSINKNIFDFSNMDMAESDSVQNGIDVQYCEESSGMFYIHLTDATIDGQKQTCAYIEEPYIPFWKNKTDFGELVIPTKVTVTDKGYEGEYKVVGIESLQGKNLGKCGITSIVINGWEKNGDTMEGGWFQSIGSEAFRWYDKKNEEGTVIAGGSLKSVTLPDCITSLGFCSFNQDTGLKTVYTQKLNSSKTDVEVVEGLPSKLTTLPESAFADCFELDFGVNGLTIPDNITYIDHMCFQRAYGLKTVSLGSGLESTGNQIFQACTGLETLNMGSSITTTGVDAFESCTSLININFSDENNQLTTINQACFKNCTSLQHIKMPYNMYSLGTEAFANCYNLNNIELNDGEENGLNSIGTYCFAMLDQNSTDNAKLEYIKLPESLKIINEGAFQNNKSIKEVIIGMKNANEATIYDGAFANIENLISVTFLWNVPRQLYVGCFNESKSQAYCAATPDIDIRFRPLVGNSEYGGRGTDETKDGNYWLKIEEAKRWDVIAPANSRLMLIAAFDNATYGNDLKKYLNEATGKFDNASFEKLNKGECTYDGTSHNPLTNGVRYKVCITIPDVLKLENTTGAILKTYAKTATPEGSKDVPAGERSKGIEFIYDDTNVHQITHKGKDLNRPADDGVLVINNNAIQVNSNNTLYVKYRSKKGEKSNPCVWGHSAGNSNPFQNTYDYLTADANQMDSLGQDKNSNSNPVILNNEPEDEIINENKPLFLSFGGGESDVTIPNACCFFSKPGGTVEDKTYEDAKLIITDNVTFGGKWTDNSLPDDERTAVDVGNTCHLGCVYNDGDLTMTDCTFQNSTGTWSGKTQKGDSYGGSCLFNYRDAKVTNCLMNKCSAKYDGGAVMNAGSLEMISCTISNCSSVRYGGAIFSNLGDTSRGAEGATALIVTGCTLTNNQSGTGGAIHYWNGSTLKLGGTLTFSGNTDSNGTSDIFISNIYESKDVQPFTLGTAFKATNKITLCAKQAKNGMVVCSSGASAVDSFTYQKDAFVLDADDSSNIILKTLYTLAIAEDGTGSWIDEKGNTVTSFTLGVATAPQVVDDKITYEDAAGVTHELTATPAEGYEFTSCKFDEGTHTYTATFTTVEQLTNRAKNFTNAIKESINTRNNDPKETLKTEIYGK